MVVVPAQMGPKYQFYRVANLVSSLRCVESGVHVLKPMEIHSKHSEVSVILLQVSTVEGCPLRRDSSVYCCISTMINMNS